jgi:hypothetical protein
MTGLTASSLVVGLTRLTSLTGWRFAGLGELEATRTTTGDGASVVATNGH